MGRIIELASVTLNLILAEKSDFLDEAGKLRMGTMYFLRSEINGEFDGRPYYLDAYTNKEDFSVWFKKKMMYVARNPMDVFAVQQEIKEIESINQ